MSVSDGLVRTVVSVLISSTPTSVSALWDIWASTARQVRNCLSYPYYYTVIIAYL